MFMENPLYRLGAAGRGGRGLVVAEHAGAGRAAAGGLPGAEKVAGDGEGGGLRQGS